MTGRSFRSRAGNVAVTAALAFVPLGFAVGIGAELSAVNAERALMQAAADAAALGAARETSVAGSARRDASAAAQSHALAQLGDFPQRAQVSFTTTPYATAYAAGLAQAKLLCDLLSAQPEGEFDPTRIDWARAEAWLVARDVA